MLQSSLFNFRNSTISLHFQKFFFIVYNFVLILNYCSFFLNKSSKSFMPKYWALNKYCCSCLVNTILHMGFAITVKGFLSFKGLIQILINLNRAYHHHLLTAWHTCCIIFQMLFIEACTYAFGTNFSFPF